MDTNGANPPLEKGWQTGKTAVVIRFVNEAEGVLGKNEYLTGDERSRLRTYIDELKMGAVALNDFVTVEEWLEQLRLYHP